MKILAATPKKVAIEELGRRLADIRKQQGYTQQQLANAAGLGVATLRRIEDGKDAQLGSWIKLLQALGLASTINDFLPEAFNSPMAEVKATRKRKAKSDTSIAAEAAQNVVIWGDEQ